MSSSAATDTDLTKELVERIQQFFSHQVESNGQLSEAARESLTVATECIEQAFGVQRKPASNELFNIYKSHRSQQQQQTPNQTSSPIGDMGVIGAAINAALGGGVGGDLRAGLAQNPTQFMQNLASSILSQATTSASSQQEQQHQQQDSASAQTSASAPQQPAQSSTIPTPPASSAPKQRKQATEAERMSAESYKNQGNDYMKQDRYKEAYDSYTRAINIDNNNAIYYSNRAAASSKLGDHQSALSDCQEAVEINPNYSKAYGRMGLTYASLDNHQKAKESYAKALELDPSNDSYRNNLRIAEEKLASNGAEAFGAAGLAGAAAGGGDMMSMLRSMMSNPEVMQMAMRGLQDPRMQNLLFGGLGGASAGAPQPDQNNQSTPPPNNPNAPR